MNEGRLVVEAAADAVAKAMEQVTDSETAELVGVQVTTVWDTPEGIRVVSQTVDERRRLSS